MTVFQVFFEISSAVGLGLFLCLFFPFYWLYLRKRL